jgi:hypothetical protein
MVTALFIIRGRATSPLPAEGRAARGGNRLGQLLQVDRSEFIAQNEVIFAISKTKVAFTQ